MWYSFQYVLYLHRLIFSNIHLALIHVENDGRGQDNYCNLLKKALHTSSLLCSFMDMNGETKKIQEVLRGIVSRVTYHNAENGWSVLRLQSYGQMGQVETVTVHQTKVFAGATMEFYGAWTIHPQYGRQFVAEKAIEKKPATAAALEKYLGSGLIKGVGPKTAQRIVRHFGAETLHVFENESERLKEVPGIADKKLETIKQAWDGHRVVREVMIFLQGHGISTLFAVRIYKKYGEQAIEIVEENPYRLATDFYGIGFFSADQVALSIGLARDSNKRVMAGIVHVLSASREQGHCYLTRVQICEKVETLLDLQMEARLDPVLSQMEQENQLKMRQLVSDDGEPERCYYAKSLFFEERMVASVISCATWPIDCDKGDIATWLTSYVKDSKVQLSEEQADAVRAIVQQPFSVLTGGPGCGKTTTTLAIVRLLEYLGRRVLLAAPTGRAAQRMSEVIGREAKTLHRLLEWQAGVFQRNEEKPFDTDFLIIDECSMLDISLSASLLKAVPPGCQLLFIGDADQLPSVGAGNVLRDIIVSATVPCYRLTRIFRQAQQSDIIRYAHEINRGVVPQIESPFKRPELWKNGTDALFLDADEATREQIDFVGRVKRHFKWQTEELERNAALQVTDDVSAPTPDLFTFRTAEAIRSAYEHDFTIPTKFQHADFLEITRATTAVKELKAVLSKIHPWSSLHYGLSCVDTVRRLYLEWIPKYMGKETEIQILSPMIRGSLGAANLNKVIQESANPPTAAKAQLQIGERLFRVGDRVIHRRNNYDLNVFNGDIGKILSINTEDIGCSVQFAPSNRIVEYQRDDLVELDLAYAITIHKSQGSEFPVVIIPVVTQHFNMLYRNLLYTGLTRGRKMVALVGSRKALAMAVRREDSSLRQTALTKLLRGDCPL